MKRATKSKKAQRGKQKEGSAFRGPRPPLLLLASRPASLSVTLAAFLRPTGTLRSPQGRRRVAPRAAAQKAHHVPHLRLAYLQTRAGWKEGGARRGQCADCGARDAPRRERLMCPFSWSLAKIAAQPASGGAESLKGHVCTGACSLGWELLFCPLLLPLMPRSPPSALSLPRALCEGRGAKCGAPVARAQPQWRPRAAMGGLPRAAAVALPSRPAPLATRAPSAAPRMMPRRGPRTLSLPASRGPAGNARWPRAARGRRASPRQTAPRRPRGAAGGNAG